MDIFNEIKEQLSSCPERTRALCRTVWGAVSTSLSTALTAASIEAGDARDDGGGGGGGGYAGAGGRWCTTITSTTSNGATAASVSNGGSGRFATIMGAVKSRSISNADVDRDEHHPFPHSQQQQPPMHQHPNSHSHSMLRNGHHSASSTGGTLQKQDLRYDIGSSSQYHHVRQPSVRSRSQQPMPTTDELDRRFAKVLVSFQIQRIILIWNNMPLSVLHPQSMILSCSLIRTLAM